MSGNQEIFSKSNNMHIKKEVRGKMTNNKKKIAEE
jgi:hypothetical protein